MAVPLVTGPMRHVLWLTFHYPPLATAGTHRNLGLTRWLLAQGWESTVLTIHPRAGLATDSGLLARVPAQLPVHRVAAPHPFEELARWRGREPLGESLPAAAAGAIERRTLLEHAKELITWPLHVPDVERPWQWNAYWRGRALVREARPDCIVASSPPATTLLAAARLSRWSGIPWVADLRDPWAANPFTAIPYPWLERRNGRLESRTLRTAACIVANTTRAADELSVRYPELAARIATVPNGFDPDTALAGSAETSLPRAAASDPITVVHAGSLYGRRRIDSLLAALASDRDAPPPFRMTLLGAGSEALAGDVKRLGLGDRIELRPPVSHREALAAMRAADVLLIAGVAGPTPETQVPAKLFEALALGRPVLALSKQGGAIQQTLEAAGATWWRADPESEGEIRTALAAIRALRRDGQDFASMRPTRLETFALPDLARRFAEILARAVADA
jgi:glycosyltransferase involved in cell wall biosynthesis